jgi:hypothetical protein
MIQEMAAALVNVCQYISLKYEMRLAFQFSAVRSLSKPTWGRES